MTVIEGQLIRGLGKAADFTQIDWVRRLGWLSLTDRR